MNDGNTSVLRRADFSAETQKNSTATRRAPAAAAILKEGTTSSGMAHYSTAELLKKLRKCSQEWCCDKATQKHYCHELLLSVSCLQKDTWFCTVIFRLCWITGRVFFFFLEEHIFADFTMFRAQQEKCCCSSHFSPIDLPGQSSLSFTRTGLLFHLEINIHKPQFTFVITATSLSGSDASGWPMTFGFLCTIAHNLCLLNINLHLKVCHLTLCLWVLDKYKWCTDKIN